MIYHVTDFGAIADGKTLSTLAIQAAINECNACGGGTVMLDGGNFVSGTIYLKSNVRLEIDISAKLIASGNISDYGDDTHYNRYVNEQEMDRCFIFAADAENIEMCGGGQVDGNAELFPNEGSIYRPMLFRFLRCKNIKMSNMRFYNAAAWTTAFLDSENIWIDNLDIKNTKRYNGDGLDFDGCKNVFIKGCKIRGTDDNLCLQSSSENYPMENVHISDCMFTSLCAGIRIGLKSIGSIRSVTITNCTFKNVWREGVKIECTEGGSISDIIASNLVMINVTRPLFVLLNNRFADIGSSIGLDKMPNIGTLDNVSFSNIIIKDTAEMKNIHLRFAADIMGRPEFAGIRIDANDNHPIRNVSISNLSYEFIGGVKRADIPNEYPKVPDLTVETTKLKNCVPFVSENYYPDWSRMAFMDIRNVQGLYLSGIRLKLLNSDERPPYGMENCEILKEEIYVI